jgi:hypothetical protein
MHTCACAGPQSAAACCARRCQRASLQRVQAHGAIQAGRHKPLGAHGQAGDHRGCAPALERLSEQALGCTRGREGFCPWCAVSALPGGQEVTRQDTQREQHHSMGPACWCRTASRSLSSSRRVTNPRSACMHLTAVPEPRRCRELRSRRGRTAAARAAHARDVQRLDNGPAVSRPHIDRALAAAGHLRARRGSRYAQSGCCTGAACRRACCPGTRAPARRRRGAAGGCRGSTVPEALSLNVTPPREMRTCWPTSAGHSARSTVRHRRTVKILAVHPAMAPRWGGGGAAWPPAAAGPPAPRGGAPGRAGQRAGAGRRRGW